MSKYLFVALTIFTLIVASCDSHSPKASSILVENCRLIKHSMGETCVPNHPQRVVTIFYGILDNALSLGVKPLGSSVIDRQNPFPPYLKNQVDGIELIGSQNAPDLEKILMLKPDLILVWQNLQGTYPLLSKISPTVIIPWRGPSTWREHLESVAKALGKEDEAQQLWKRYYQRINELKMALGDRYQNKKISVVTPTSQLGFFVHAKNSFVGSIINDLGLERPKVQDVNTESGYVTFTSEEELQMLDGDILFIMVDRDEDRKTFEKVMQKPLGQTLKVAQQGSVYFVDGLVWFGPSLTAADIVLDDLEKYLINTP